MKVNDTNIKVYNQTNNTVTFENKHNRKEQIISDVVLNLEDMR